ncbi:MAG TPA: ABC transporter ATP-binding protein [Polyangia bacterium]|jgi:iron complex transport system ATP-binding protein
MALYELRAVHFAYGARAALGGPGGLDLDLAAGTIVGIVGPNGAGKSTLIRLLGGLAAPGAGTIRFAGAPLAGRPRRELARAIAYVPQDYSLEFPFTVGEVVLMGRYPHHGPAALEDAHDLTLARAAMERTDMWALRDRRFGELSGGERRRVVLAQAFCQETEVILLDEPTAALDAAHELTLARALAAGRAERGTTVVLVTHNLSVAARLCERVVCLSAGRVVADGAPLAVLGGEAVSAAFGVRFHVARVPGADLPFVVPVALR